MGTLIAMLAVIKQGDNLSALPLDPALIMKCKEPKVILSHHNLLVNTDPTCVINANSMRDHFVPHLNRQLAKTNAVLDALPGGLTMFVQSIDTALAALYRIAHHRENVAHMEGKLAGTQES